MSKILIVEDDHQLCHLLENLLEKQGHEVVTAFDGEQGAKLYNRHEPDYIILDIVMPEKDGLEFIQEIKESGSDKKILAISGGGSSHNSIMYLKMARQLGADFILPKPFHIEQLMRCMQMLGCEVSSMRPAEALSESKTVK